MTDTLDTTYVSTCLARQPIFDRELETWGYLLLFRDTAESESAVFMDGSDATTKLVADLPLHEGAISKDSRLLIHFPRLSVIEEIPRALPPDRTVVLLDGTADASPKFIKPLSELKEDGYVIAMDEFDGSEPELVIGLADILVVDLLENTIEQVTRLAQKGREMSRIMLAKKVESREAFEKAKNLGFALFQGFFFKEPKNISSRKITSSEISRLKLFEIITHEQADFEALIPAIEADVAISYRLLNFLNSAHFGFTKKINSIRQAVILAGWHPLRNWLRLILLTDMAPGEKSAELSYASAHRAKFLETLAIKGGHEHLSNSLFMLGLFSLLDALLDMPMTKILRHLPLDNLMAGALTGKANRFSSWLEIVDAIEHDNWDKMTKIIHDLGLPPGTVAESYREAYAWADSFFALTVKNN